MPVTYDQIQTARQAGYSDTDIINHLATTDSQVKTAIDSGYNPGEIINHLANNKPSYNVDVNSKTSLANNQLAMLERNPDFQSLPKSEQDRIRKQATDVPILSRIKEGVKSAVKTAMPYVRPVVEGLGAGAGGVVGGTLGAGAGGIGAIPGGVAGAALGYAGAKNLMDTTDAYSENAPMQTPRQLLTTTAADLATGATMEMGGQVAGKALSYVAPKVVNAYRSARSSLANNTPALTESGVKAAAGKILNENIGLAPLYESNAVAAEQVAEDIPGFRASLGEARNDPGLIKLQRGMESQPGTAADLAAQKNSANRQALAGHLDAAFPAQNSVEDALATISANKSGIEAGTQAADLTAQRTAQGLKPIDAQSAGRNVIDAIEAERLPAKQAVSEQYDSLPNDALPTSNTAAAIRDLKKGFRPGDEDVFPARAISRVEEALQGPKPSTGGHHGKPADLQILDAQGIPIRQNMDMTKAEVGFQDLHSLRKDIGRQIQDASTGMNPNRELAAKLKIIKSAIDSDIESGMGANNDYTAARQAFSDYANKFRSGDVEAVLRRGNQSTGRNVPDALIAKKMATPDGADSFINAVGTTKAATAMEGHFANDLVSKVANPLTGELNPKGLAAWVSKNGAVLDKYGLRGQFDTVNTAHQSLDAAKTAEAAFNKTVAAKMLNADPQNAIASAMGGAEGLSAKNTGAIMAKLVKQVQGNPQAVDGLKNGFKDFIINLVETTKKTQAGDNAISPASIQKALAKYDPAMRVLYKDSPQQLAALQNIQKAVEIQGRSASTPLAGSSGTAENMAVHNMLNLILDRIPLVNTTAKLTRMGLSAIKNMNTTEVNTLVAKALYDPELAQTLMMAAKGQAPKEVERRIGSFLSTLRDWSEGKLRDERGLVGWDINQGGLTNYEQDSKWLLLNKKAIESKSGADISAAFNRRADIAQYNASLPESQGGLGLSADNTPAQRSKAMGFRSNIYHGTSADIRSFEKNKLGSNTGSESSKISIGTSTHPDQAAYFADLAANGKGANIMPLLNRGRAALLDVPPNLRSNNPLFAATLADAYDKGIDVVAANGYSEGGVSAVAPHINANKPHLLRSAFAHFDPAQMKNPDLLAGVGALVLAQMLKDNIGNEKKR